MFHVGPVCTKAGFQPSTQHHLSMSLHIAPKVTTLDTNKSKRYLLLVFLCLYLRTWETQFSVYFSSEQDKIREYCSYFINRDLGGQMGCQDLKGDEFLELVVEMLGEAPDIRSIKRNNTFFKKGGTVCLLVERSQGTS